jgi:hypothetical protein
MKPLTKDEAKIFLLPADLQELAAMASVSRLQAIIDGDRSPYVVVRGKYIQLFDILELLGTV